MGSKEIDKTKPKNWIDGDTFAVKIENTNTEYDGRYIILNKYSMPKGNPKINYFRAMITLNEDYPSLDQINNLEYIKIIYRTFYERYYPLSGGETFAECVMRKSHLKFYPDEYNYLYSYTIEFDVKGNKDVQKMKYIGNKIIDAPYDEYFINGDEIKSQYIPSNDLIQKLIKAYEGYNKKKSIIYDPKQQKIIKQNAINSLRITMIVEKKLQFYKKNHKLNEYAKEEDGYYYHEAYVGGDPNHKDCEDE